MKSKIHEKNINTNCFQRLLSCTLKLESRMVQTNKKNCTLKITTQKKERKINYTKTIQLCLNNMNYKYSANKKKSYLTCHGYIYHYHHHTKFLSNQIHNLSRDATLLHKV